jgi:hypothetical protein
MEMKNPVRFTKCSDPTRTMDDPRAVWTTEMADDVWKYFRLDCCSPGTADSLDEFYFKDYVQMYYCWRSCVYEDKMSAEDDGDWDRDPYNYLMYYIVDEPQGKDKHGHDVVVQHEYPVKVYKRHGKIFCKYL